MIATLITSDGTFALRGNCALFAAYLARRQRDIETLAFGRVEFTFAPGRTMAELAETDLLDKKVLTSNVVSVR